MELRVVDLFIEKSHFGLNLNTRYRGGDGGDGDNGRRERI